MQAPQVADVPHHYDPIQVPQTELQHQQTSFIQVPQIADCQHHHQIEVSQISGFQNQYSSIESRQIAGI